MPVYRITDTATSEHWLVDEPTAWDAWMHFKMTIHAFRWAGDRRSLSGRFDAKAAPGGHDFAIERLALGSGKVVEDESTYITLLAGGSFHDQESP
jgi:hypothetical protein